MEVLSHDRGLNVLTKTQGESDNTELGWLLTVWSKLSEVRNARTIMADDQKRDQKVKKTCVHP